MRINQHNLAVVAHQLEKRLKKEALKKQFPHGKGQYIKFSHQPASSQPRRAWYNLNWFL